MLNVSLQFSSLGCEINGLFEELVSVDDAFVVFR